MDGDDRAPTPPQLPSFHTRSPGPNGSQDQRSNASGSRGATPSPRAWSPFGGSTRILPEEASQPEAHSALPSPRESSSQRPSTPSDTPELVTNPTYKPGSPVLTSPRSNPTPGLRRHEKPIEEARHMHEHPHHVSVGGAIAELGPFASFMSPQASAKDPQRSALRTPTDATAADTEAATMSDGAGADVRAVQDSEAPRPRPGSSTLPASVSVFIAEEENRLFGTVAAEDAAEPLVSRVGSPGTLQMTPSLYDHFAPERPASGHRSGTPPIDGSAPDHGMEGTPDELEKEGSARGSSGQLERLPGQAGCALLDTAGDEASAALAGAHKVRSKQQRRVDSPRARYEAPMDRGELLGSPAVSPRDDEPATERVASDELQLFESRSENALAEHASEGRHTVVSFHDEPHLMRTWSSESDSNSAPESIGAGPPTQLDPPTLLGPEELHAAEDTSCIPAAHSTDDPPLASPIRTVRLQATHSKDLRDEPREETNTDTKSWARALSANVAGIFQSPKGQSKRKLKSVLKLRNSKNAGRNTSVMKVSTPAPRRMMGRTKHVRFKEPVSRDTLKLVRFAILLCRPGSRAADYWKLGVACVVAISFLLNPFVGVKRAVEDALNKHQSGFSLDSVGTQLFLVERMLDLVLLLNVLFVVSETILEELGLRRTMIDKIADSTYDTRQGKQLDVYVAIVVKGLQSDQSIWTPRVMSKMRKRMLTYTITTLPRIVLELVDMLSNHSSHWSLFALVTCLRAYQLVDLFKFWNKTEQDFSKNVSLTVAAKFAFLVLATAHTLGCVYYYTAALSKFNPEEYRQDWLMNWVIEDNVDYHYSNLNLGATYLMILYRGFNVLTALGYQEEIPYRGTELALSILGNYCKIVIEAYIFGLIFHYLVKPNPEVQANQKRLAAAEQYCDARNLPLELKTKLTKYVKFQQSHASAVSEQVLTALPQSLKAKLAHERCTRAVQRNMHIFQGCSTQFLSRFMMSLHEVHLMPNEVVLKAGDIARELSFVEVGNLQILDDTDQVVEILAGEGTTPCVVGATSFFMGIPEQHNVRARSDEECALLAINKAECNDVIATLPEENDVITRNILNMYGLNKEGEDTGGAGAGSDEDAFAAIQDAIRAVLKQTQDRALEQLISAASVGDVDTMDTLIAQGCPLNAGDYDARTPLHVAVSMGQKSSVQLLLERGAVHSPVDRWGIDPLKDAIVMGLFDIAEMLTTKGARLHMSSKHFPIMEKTASTNLSNLQTVVLKAEANVDVGDCDSRTLLHSAAAQGNITVVQNLISVGANPHSKDRWGGTPIEDAIKNNEPLITAFLAWHGARASPKYQQEALFYAAQVGSVQFVEVLAESGANLSSQNYDEVSAIHVAAYENNVAALAAIVSRRFENVNTKDQWGRTPLDYAVASQSWPSVVFLISHAGRTTDPSGRELITEAAAGKRLPDLDRVRQCLNQVNNSQQPDAAALGALYGVSSNDGAAQGNIHPAVAQQRRLLSRNLKALETLRIASLDISTAFTDVLTIATALSEILGVAAPKQALNKSLTRTASLKAKPRKDLTKALIPVLMRSTAVQEACRHLGELVERAVMTSEDKDVQLRKLLNDAGMREEHLSIDAGVPLHKAFSACLAGSAGVEKLDTYAVLACPVFRRNVEDARAFNLLNNAKHSMHDTPLVTKLTCCYKWSDELWVAMAPQGTGFDFTKVAPQLWQVLKTQGLEHLWSSLSKLLEERHESLDRNSFAYVFFLWLSMSEQADSDDGRPFGNNDDESASSGFNDFDDFDIEAGQFASDEHASAGDDVDDQDALFDEDEDEEATVEAKIDWEGLLNQAEHAESMPAAKLTRSAGIAEEQEAAAAPVDEDKLWLEEFIAHKGTKTVLKKLLKLTWREQLGALVGREISNREKGCRIFKEVNQSGSGMLPPSVLDVLASCFSQELHFNRQTLDLVEKYLDANNPLRKEDFEAVFALLSVPGDDAKLPPDAPWYIIHPNSPRLRHWNRLTKALAIYFFWEIPVSIAFRPAVTFGEDFVFANRALELILALDVASNFARAFYSENGTLIYKPARIQRAYLSEWSFAIDLVTFFPFNLILVLGAVPSQHQAYAWLRLPRLIAVARTLLYRRDGKNLFLATNKSGDLSARAMLYCIVTLLIGVTCLTHLMACCWWYIGTSGQPHTRDEFEVRYGALDDEDNRPPHWPFFHRGLGEDHIWLDGVSVLLQYYFSFYWTASTLSTSGLVGETTPKNLAEISFTILCMLATITVWAYIMGEISNLVLSSSERLVAIREKVQLVQTFLQKRDLTRGLANDIITVFYEKLHSNDDTAAVFSTLSSSLMFEVAMHLSLPLIKSLEVFGTCSSSFVASLSVLLREKQLASDETLFALGDAANSLYIIASSSITLTVPGIGDEEVECGRLAPGSMVGEIAFFFRLRHISTATVGAKAATLFVLSRQDYDQLCSSYVLDSELVMKAMIDIVNGGGKAGASQVSTSEEMPDNVRRKLQSAIKRQTETATLLLIEAASLGDITTVRNMLDAGRVHIDDSDYDARTALHLAASNDHLEVVQVLLDLGASIAPRDRLLGTPMDDAVRHRRFEVVRYLAASHQQRIEATPAYIATWIQAAADDDLELVQVLLLAGMPVNSCNSDNRTALHIAVCNRSFQVVKHLLSLPEIQLGAMDRMGSTAMWDALVACDSNMCKLLGDKGAPVQDDIATYMCKAASEDNNSFIDLTCEHDVDILCRDLFGRTPLHVAASRGALRCVDAMAHKLGDKVNTVDVFGKTPLDNAVQAEDAVAIAILKSTGGLRGDDASLAKQHADVCAWSEVSRRARRAKHLQSVAAHLPESRAGWECVAVSQALTAFVRVMYSNTNIYTAALHEAARQQLEAKQHHGTSHAAQTASGSTGVETRVKAALSAIVYSLTELRDVVAAPPKPYTVIEYPLLRKVSRRGGAMSAQVRTVKEKLEKVIDLASKVLATLEHDGMRLQTFAVQRLNSMLSRGIWTHLNIAAPGCVLEMTDDELSYVQRWDRSAVQRFLTEKLEVQIADQPKPESAPTEFEAQKNRRKSLVELRTLTRKLRK